MKELDDARYLFGENRAEWSASAFQDLFIEPGYLKRLQSRKPSFIVGGRGTGKTTSLMSLRYEATYENEMAKGGGFSSMKYLGVLVRMNKNRVRAFRGANVSAEHWSKCFAHYINLLVVLELCKLTEWVHKTTGQALSTTSIREVSADLGLSDADDIDGLASSVRTEMSQLQLHVNNPSKPYGGALSVAESPLRVFVEVMRRDGLLSGKTVYCCIDEYENLLDYQQAILNTYIKHAEEPLSYKVGMRKFGLRTRQTIDESDLLNCPDDYEEIEIAADGFEDFARSVAEARLRRANSNGISVPTRLRDFLQDLSIADEARLLGAEQVSHDIRARLKGKLDSQSQQFMDALSDDVLYFSKYWSESEGTPIIDLIASWKDNPQKWETRIGNYGFASLFWLSKGRKGVRIRKYYCGERTLMAMAAGNIRYLLELVDLAMAYEPPSVTTGGFQYVSPKAQTLAAREVGKRRLSQLDGLADNGPHLKRVVLALGKVFFELARNPLGKIPEATSFVLKGSAQELERAQELLIEGVSHLAFEAEARTKATSSSEMRDDEYRIHRIFSAFFEMSHRKKRRVTVSAQDILNVLDEKPSVAIAAMLGDVGVDPDEALPEQLEFFAKFYRDERGSL